MSVAAKESLRTEAKARLRSLSRERRHSLGAEIGERIWSFPAVIAAETIFLFASMDEEVPTDAIAEEARRRGIITVYPRCLPDGITMTLHRVSSGLDLATGRFGIREPILACPSIAIEKVDVALIPGLAWDRAGTRLGRGAGYYDRVMTSPEWRALSCGIFLALQEMADLPVDPWDVPLDAIVTEKEIWKV